LADPTHDRGNALGGATKLSVYSPWPTVRRTSSSQPTRPSGGVQAQGPCPAPSRLVPLADHGLGTGRRGATEPDVQFQGEVVRTQREVGVVRGRIVVGRRAPGKQQRGRAKAELGGVDLAAIERPCDRVRAAALVGERGRSNRCRWRMWRSPLARSEGSVSPGPSDQPLVDGVAILALEFGVVCLELGGAELDDVDVVGDFGAGNDVLVHQQDRASVLGRQLS
jgi:hypothetical protein